MSSPGDEVPVPADGRPVVLRGGTVLTMDDATRSSPAATCSSSATGSPPSGAAWRSRRAPRRSTPRGGIVMPGMIDTHRHMWQTAMRGYGADWTLTQYFVWYYLEHGKVFRPEDVHAGNLLSAWEALDAGVTTTVDWSHGLQTRRATPRRPSTRCRRCRAGSCSPTATSRPAPWEWTADPGVRAFFERPHRGDDLLGFQLAFDVTGDPAFPEKAAFEVARELGLPVTTHAGVWGATNDDGIRLMHEHGFMDPGDGLRARRHAVAPTPTTGSRPPAARCRSPPSREQSAGQGYPPTWQLRRHGIPVSLSMDTSVWWSGDLFSAMRTTLGADRSREHLEAHAKGETVTHVHLRAEHVVDWATRGGARALGRDDLGALRAGQEGRRRADQERRLAGVVPAAQPLRARGLPGPARRRAHRRSSTAGW